MDSQFDEFCRLKNTGDTDVDWDSYLSHNNIKPIFLSKSSVNMQKLEHLRIYFLNEDIWYDAKLFNIGWSPMELDGKYTGNIIYDYTMDLMVQDFINCGYIRSPKYLTLAEIIVNKYYDLAIYLIKKYYTALNITPILDICGENFVRDLFASGKVYIIYKDKRINSLSQCIHAKDIKSCIYLLKKIGLKPSEKERDLIENVFPALGEMLFLIE